MAGVLFTHADAGQTVGTAFGGEVKIRDFRKLLLQNRHKDFIQRHSQDGRFVRRPPRVSTVIDGIIPVCNAFYCEDREAFDFIIVAGMIAEWSFIGLDTGFKIALKDKFRTGRHLQVIAFAFDEFGFGAT